jgi:tRNA nucleotidyltransferase (CCA-adding enzyme)
MLTACEADYRGRTGYAERDYPQGLTLRLWRDQVAAVDVAVIARAAREPRLIPVRVREARLSALKRAMHHNAATRPTG